MQTSEKLFETGRVYQIVLEMAKEAKAMQKDRLESFAPAIGLTKESKVVFDKKVKENSQ